MLETGHAVLEEKDGVIYMAISLLNVGAALRNCRVGGSTRPKSSTRTPPLTRCSVRTHRCDPIPVRFAPSRGTSIRHRES